MIVKWLLRALNDLAAITTYIERDNPDAARHLAQSIREQTKQLAAFPFMGRASEKPDVRELVVHKNYLVSYRIQRDTIEILQVWHAAQMRGGNSGVAARDAGVSPPRRTK